MDTTYPRLLSGLGKALTVIENGVWNLALFTAPASVHLQKNRQLPFLHLQGALSLGTSYLPLTAVLLSLLSQVPLILPPPSF